MILFHSGNCGNHILPEKDGLATMLTWYEIHMKLPHSPRTKRRFKSFVSAKKKAKSK